MDSVAIVGLGIIGSSWAVVFARAGLEVAIWDRTGRGEAAILATLNAMAESVAGTSCALRSDALSRVRVSRDLADVLRGASYMQESGPEDLALKRDVLGEIARTADPDTILASSTSGLRPSDLAEGLAGPERFLVVHPLTPPHLLPVTEIVPGRSTAGEVVERTEAFMAAVGQSPVRLLRETPGFAANRILAAMLNEFFHLIREGVLRPEDADTIITQGFGLRWACLGPFAAMDLNAPGGIADYLKRYGGIMQAVARDRHATPGLDADVIETLGAAMRARHSLADNPARAAARDRAIAQLRTVRTVVT